MRTVSELKKGQRFRAVEKGGQRSLGNIKVKVRSIKGNEAKGGPFKCTRQTSYATESKDRLFNHAIWRIIPV